MLAQYDDIIEEQLQSGVIEPVIEKDPVSVDQPVHYMPHHAVVREDKETTKVRIVYDGSAHEKKDEASINDCLKQGPNLIPSLFDILLKFRSHKIGLIADIEKAFLMISIDQSDRDSLRFLWYKNVMSAPQPVIYRFCRLVFGLRPSPAILGATILHHLDLHEHEDPVVAEKLRDCLYVDDLTTGAESEDEALRVYASAKTIMSKGGFNLRKWKTNSPEVRAVIGMKEDAEADFSTVRAEGVSEDDQTYAKTSLGTFESNTHLAKILGVSWDTESDMLMYDFDELWNYVTSLPPTKRSVLRFSARLFDPLGLVAPFTINMKLMFQSMCVDKCGWDEELSQELKSRWDFLVQELYHLAEIRIPRCYFSTFSERQRIELHGFCDASGKAYAAVVYLRAVFNDHVEVALLCCKTRVAPLKLQTIPRLELLGALILARLMECTSRALAAHLPVSDMYYWTDSVTVLCWIQNDKPWKQFVVNRVNEIRKITSVRSWRHCPGTLNPADLPSRGITACQLVNSKVWWKGPEFLREEEENWPRLGSSDVLDELALSEMLKQPTESTHVLVNRAQEDMPLPSIGNVVTCKSFSNIHRLLRVTSYVLRFVANLKHCVCKTEGQLLKGPLTAEEVNQANLMWELSVQHETFSKEFEDLTTKKSSCPRSPYVRQFGLFVDDQGLSRCKGRLEHSSLSYSSNNPILLPQGHHFTNLVIKGIHSKIKHSGIRDTLTALREKYWVPRGRATVKQFIRHCIICIRYAGQTFPMLTPPSLPEERVADAPPFTNTGVDYAGPLYVKIKRPEADGSTLKAYISMFTCASTRAVHLELVEDCSADQFLLAFRRFVSRRGVPRLMLSDNAKNFKASSKEILKIGNSRAVQDHMANLGTRWKFIVEKAPWWGRILGAPHKNH